MRNINVEHLLLLVVEIKLTISSRGNESIYFQTNVPLGIFAYHILAHFPSKKKKHGRTNQTNETKKNYDVFFHWIEWKAKITFYIISMNWFKSAILYWTESLSWKQVTDKTKVTRTFLSFCCCFCCNTV